LSLGVVSIHAFVSLGPAKKLWPSTLSHSTFTSVQFLDPTRLRLEHHVILFSLRGVSGPDMALTTFGGALTLSLLFFVQI
jgi:hypothetical protein